jgi:hypothetical protein
MGKVLGRKFSAMIKVVPLGAGQDVGRSCLILSIGGRNLMLDWCVGSCVCVVCVSTGLTDILAVVCTWDTMTPGDFQTLASLPRLEITLKSLMRF